MAISTFAAAATPTGPSATVSTSKRYSSKVRLHVVQKELAVEIVSVAHEALCAMVDLDRSATFAGFNGQPISLTSYEKYDSVTWFFPLNWKCPLRVLRLA